MSAYQTSQTLRKGCNDIPEHKGRPSDDASRQQVGPVLGAEEYAAKDDLEVGDLGEPRSKDDCHSE
jgi:hypothetical protein